MPDYEKYIVNEYSHISVAISEERKTRKSVK